MKKGIVLIAFLFSFISEPLADSTVHTDDQCLASVIYYEARGESLKGKRAVLDVVKHRMQTSGKSACTVVKQRKQFSWYPQKPIKRYNKEMQQLLAEVRAHGKVLINERYLYFFSKRIKPKWAYNMECRTIGKHNFCKEKVKNV